MEKSVEMTPKTTTMAPKTTSGRIYKGLERISHSTSSWFEKIAMVALVGIIITTLIDVIGDKLFSKPVAPGTEFVYLLQVIAIAGALAATKISGRHIRLEFVDQFPRILNKIFTFFTGLLGLVLVILLAWKSYDYALSLKNVQEVTAAARIPLYPFVLWLAVCCIPLCLVLLKEMLKSLSRW